MIKMRVLVDEPALLSYFIFWKTALPYVVH
jgi:hypothetical protein